MFHFMVVLLPGLFLRFGESTGWYFIITPISCLTRVSGEKTLESPTGTYVFKLPSEPHLLLCSAVLSPWVF